MDDDVLRRGKPTCHVEFDEATALLVGDALQSLAFQLLAEQPPGRRSGRAARDGAAAGAAPAARAAWPAARRSISPASGKPLNLPELEFMHIHKTGALIRAAVLLGAHCGDRWRRRARERLDHYAKCVGLAFQVVDDMLDCGGQHRHAGQDRRQGRRSRTSRPMSACSASTRAREFAEELRGEAHAGARRAFGAARRSACAELADFIVLTEVLMIATVTGAMPHASRQPIRHVRAAQAIDDLRAARARAQAAAAAGRRAARLPGRVGVADRRPSVVQPRHGGADHRAALRVRYARGPLVWDVGHQTYAHKILTGRREAHEHGCACAAAFPASRGAARAPTTPSAPATPAPRSRPRSAWRWPRKQQGEAARAVAIIGDGAMTAGMAFEALNNAGATDADLLVVLNDNDMSISPPVGALNNYLARLMSGTLLRAARAASENMLKLRAADAGTGARAEEHVKGMVTPGTLFEEFGFNYIGPIDGHDLDVLIPTLDNIKKLKGPQFLHVVTQKGKGYKLAEDDPILYHGVAQVRPGERHQVAKRRRQADLHPGLRRLAVRHGGGRSAPGRHHAGDARGLRHGALSPRSSRSATSMSASPSSTRVTFAAGLACEGLQAGGGDLLDLPAARLRPADPRRRAAEPAGACSRSTAAAWSAPTARPTHGSLRPLLSALHPQHGGDGAGRRERMPPDALHRLRAGRPARGALSARRRHRRVTGSEPARRCRWARAKCAATASDVAILAFGSLLAPALAAAEAARCHGGQHALRQAAGCRADRTNWRANHDAAGHAWKKTPCMGGAGQAVAECSAARGHRGAAAAARPARPLHRAWRPGQAARRAAASTRRDRALRRAQRDDAHYAE